MLRHSGSGPGDWLLFYCKGGLPENTESGGKAMMINKRVCHCPAGVHATDSGVYCGGADLGEKAAVEILGAVHGFWGYLSGKSAGAYHAENLSGRCL